MRKKYRKKRATKLKKRKGKRRKRLRKKSRNRFAKIGRKKEREKKERIRGWNGDKFDSLPLRRGKLEILFLVQGKGMGKCEICKIEDGDDGDFAVIKCIFQPINIWNIKFQRKWWEGYMSLSRIACVAVIFAYFFSSFSYAPLRYFRFVKESWNDCYAGKSSRTFIVDVTVIWASLRFRRPYSQNPTDMGIPGKLNPNPNPNR